MSTAYRLTTTIDSSELQSPHQKKSWAFVFDALNSTGCPLMLRVLDTIVFAKAPWRPKYWIFTDQDNFVRKRGISKLSVDDIVKACIQSLNLTTSSAEVLVFLTQMSLPRTTDRKVCFLVAKRVRRLVNLMTLWNLRNAEDQDIEVLQVYHIAGKPFDGFIYYHCYNSLTRSSTVTKRPLEGMYSEEVSCSENAVMKRIEEDTLAVQGVMETYHSCVIAFLKLSYLVEKGPSNRPRAVQLNSEPKPQSKSHTLSLAKPRSKPQAKIAPISLHTHPDPFLSVVTLSSVHCPSFTPSLQHKTTHEILTEIQTRKARYENYKNKLIVKWEDKGALRRNGTSHSLVIPSVDLDQTEVSSATNEEFSFMSPAAPEPIDSESLHDHEVLNIDPRQYLKDPTGHIRGLTLELSTESLPVISESSAQSRVVTPERKMGKGGVRIRKKRETAAGSQDRKRIKGRKDSEELSGLQNNASFQQGDRRVSRALSTPSTTPSPCQGDYCSLIYIRVPQIDPSKRFPVPQFLIAKGKQPEFNPVLHPELVTSPSQVMKILESESKQSLDRLKQMLDCKHTIRKKVGSRLMVRSRKRGNLKKSDTVAELGTKAQAEEKEQRSHSRSLLQVPPKTKDEALVCARCFLIYESVRRCAGE